MKNKTLIFILLLILSGCSHHQYKAVSYYVVGDQDEWQLFMGIDVYNDIVSGAKDSTKKKVVIIYTTAGDNSCDGTPIKVPEYYYSHEAGKNSTVEFCADQTGVREASHAKRDTILNHDILKYQYKNVVSYNLRLPGGCINGGFNGQSLHYLHDGLTSSLWAVDGTTKYSGWNDLVKTIHQIIINENKENTKMIFNTADTNVTINPGDHPDNIYSARLCLDATASIPHLTVNFFQEYITANLPVNLSNSEIATEAALFSQVDYWLTNFGYPSEFTPEKVKCTARNYFRTVVR